MGGTIVVPKKQPVTVQQQKQRVHKKIIKPKPGAPPVALTNSDVKNAVKGWLDNQLKLWMARVGDTQDAIHLADMKFQDIMSHKTTTPVADALLETLIVGVATALAPELVAGAAVFKQVIHEAEFRKKAAEVLVDLTKESASEIKKSLDETKAEEDAGHAKVLAVQFFQKLYARVGAIRDRATVVNVRLTHYIDVGISSNDPKLRPKLDDAVGVWCDAGLQTEDSLKVNSEQLSLFFLYDLMRAYCRQNVTLTTASHLVSLSWELDGLDPERRKAMYEYFKDIKWKDPRRPVIQNWDDLMNNWSFQREGN